MNNVMKNNTQTQIQNNIDSANLLDDDKAIEKELANDADIKATAKMYQKEAKQRKALLMVSQFMNLAFVVTAYSILCYDTTGRLFGRLLGINL